jgi:hypothetical protein
MRHGHGGEPAIALYQFHEEQDVDLQEHESCLPCIGVRL